MNYTGTAPAMEVEVAKRISERSIPNRSIRYTSYYRDASRAYETVKFVKIQINRFKHSNVLAITRNVLVVGFAN